MTVSYSLAAATASAGTVLRLIFRWRGSAWSLIYRECIAWIALCVFANFVYFAIIKESVFDVSYRRMVMIIDRMPSEVTLFLLLSFSTSTSLTRWQNTFQLLAWPENVAMMFNAFFNDSALSPATADCIRRTTVRYILLSYILLFRDVSCTIRMSWFPTMEKIVDSGLLTENELALMRSSRMKRTACHYWVPLLWICQLLKKRYRSGKSKGTSVMGEKGYDTFVNEVMKTRGKLGDILSYDWVPLPLALTQTLTVFVCSQLLGNIFRLQARLMNIKESESMWTAVIVQGFHTITFNSLIIAWLRISQVVLNPFGQDEDDFEVPYLLQRHFDVLNSMLCSPQSEVSLSKKKRAHDDVLPHTWASALIGSRASDTMIASTQAIEKRLRKNEKEQFFVNPMMLKKNQ